MTDEERADILADDGYRYIEIDGELYRADMVAWALQTGEWPEGEIEHINGDRADNCWLNLRVKRC
jgi:HNH endonuclease